MFLFGSEGDAGLGGVELRKLGSDLGVHVGADA